MDMNNYIADNVTNTIIVTSSTIDVVDSKNIDILYEWLNQNILLKYDISNDNPIQVILLKNFKRILIVSPDHDMSQKIISSSTQSVVSNFRFSFSLTDTTQLSEKKYLELPQSERMFLISPPSSPPPEFDYARCEEKPNSDIISKAHLDEKPHLYSIVNDPQNSNKSITLLDTGTTKIVVNTCDSVENVDQNSKIDKIPTFMPPVSIFDDDEDMISDVDN